MTLFKTSNYQSSKGKICTIKTEIITFDRHRNTHTHGYYLTGLVSRFGQRWEPQGFPLKTTSAKKNFYKFSPKLQWQHQSTGNTQT